MNDIHERNNKYAIEMIYLSNFAKKEKLEDPGATPLLVTPRRNGKHTVAVEEWTRLPVLATPNPQPRR